MKDKKKETADRLRKLADQLENDELTHSYLELYVNGRTGNYSFVSHPVKQREAELAR